MKWELIHNTIDKILVVKTEGVLDLPSADRMRAEGWKVLKEHKYLRCLLDHSKADGISLSTLEIYDLPKRYKELNIPYNFRMAVVVPNTMQEDMAFFETVCRNNGYSVSVFFDHESALSWLKS
ncbi:MAG: hypothetical protein IPO22_06215 [Anaerolineales bacterium]|jgi:hypothetical protein|nr:hypothetical protein [Anaerolineales bacterium]